MNKKGQNTNTILVIVVVALIAFGVYWFYNMREKPSAGPDLFGEVNDDGECVGREGMDVVMCCGKQTASGLVWVPCETVIDTSQAIVTTGGTTYNVDAIMFAVRITNDGSNIPISADITSVSTTGGQTVGQTEFNTAWQEVVNLPAKTIGVGAFDEFSMTSSKPIRLSTTTSPPGTFTMPDGVYTSTIYVTATGGGKTVTNSKAITLDIKQATIGFTIDVKIVG